MITATGVVRDTRLPRGRLARPGRRVRAVDGLNLEISPGELLGIVGPTGAGKATTGLLLTGRLAPDAGTVSYQGADLQGAGRRERGSLREQLQLVGPGADELSRRAVVGEVLAEAVGAGSTRRTVPTAPEPEALLTAIGLDAGLVEQRIGKLTDSQRGRVALARVMALNPALVVLDLGNGSMPSDERDLILEVLLRLRAEVGTAVVVLAPEIADVSTCDAILVMYLGRVVEVLDATDLPDESLHPYTHALLAVGSGVSSSAQSTLKGRPLAPGQRPSGCVFRTRCFKAQDLCADQTPQLSRPLGSTHPVACHFPQRWAASAAGSSGPGAADGDRPEPTAQEFAEG